MELQNKITNLKELFEVVIKENSENEGQIWWRGQSNACWGLDPKIFRSEKFTSSETNFIARFKQKAPSRHSRIPLNDDIAGWLFLMQHYGLPTRLLDWTESPLIASFFAVQRQMNDEGNEVNGALFAISPYKLNKDQVEKFQLLMPDHSITREILEHAFSQGDAEHQRVVAIRPSEVDIRIVVQLSVFTLHDKEKNDLVKLENSSKFISKWLIPAENKKNIMEELKYFGIRLSSIFPDLEHLAEEIEKTDFSRYREYNNNETEPKNNLKENNYSIECST